MSDLDSIQQDSRDQFSKQSHCYGKSHVLADISDVEEGFRKLSPPPSGKALDMATGAGHTALFLARQGLEVTAADLSAAMLERTQEAAKEEGITLHTEEHSAEKFPYEDNTFSIVTCRVATHHFSSPEDFIQEVSRVLKPGGNFLLIDGSVEDGHPEAEEWIHQIEKLRDTSHNRFLTPFRIEHHCRVSGLEPIDWWMAPMKQPDLEWYFETADTPDDNRKQVEELVTNAPDSARELFKLTEEDGKIVWWWQRLTFIARKSSQ